MTTFDKDRLASDPEALREFNRQAIEDFRTNGGHITALPGGSHLLLHTTGARSGEPRVTPLAYVPVGDRMLVIGSALGSATAPAWVHNLRVHPSVRVEVGAQTLEVTARELGGAERDDVFATVVEKAPVLAEYQAGVDRVIPLFELVRS